jgi:hypothetical protein
MGSETYHHLKSIIKSRYGLDGQFHQIPIIVIQIEMCICCALLAIVMMLSHCMFLACNVGDEGGFAPSIQKNDEGIVCDFLSCKLHKFQLHN